eukprot:CAMPEP_0194271018 /NCGR_PEP_ID=MMETSP0169-20130528/4912_1 /TAXON_ID=218684 /ORGANISM="Corethron pennatum, Strain L29A3" /LENGTH=414 /DNA_ID=CAMNT_0039013271 /DNA_START=26 /DNA_END=1267 /DNA_ORIENTATION=-
MMFSPVILSSVLLGTAEAFLPAKLHSSRRPRRNLAMSSFEAEWSPSTWKNQPVGNMLTFDPESDVEGAFSELSGFCPLVFAGEVRALHEQIARASQGGAFMLMGGDNSETFDEFSTDRVRDTFRVLLQMALVLTFGSAMPVIKVGRMGGQFSAAAGGQAGDPQNMVRAYHESAQTLNILRAFSSGGYADISRLHAWNLDFIDSTEEGTMYRKFAAKVDESLRFMSAIGVDTASPAFTQTDFYTAHECVMLPYEESQTRKDSTTMGAGTKWYGCSSHMLWIGEKNRQLDSAHLEYVRGVNNPLGIKISDKCTPGELLDLLDAMNPKNQPGRVTVIVRMGASKVRTNLPGLIRAVQREGRSVLWVSDPMHGNTHVTEGGTSTRSFEKIREELRAFFDVHDEMGSHPGGVHLEMTGK